MSGLLFDRQWPLIGHHIENDSSLFEEDVSFLVLWKELLVFSHKARHSNLNQQQIWVSIPTKDGVGLVSEEAAEDGSFILGIFKRGNRWYYLLPPFSTGSLWYCFARRIWVLEPKYLSQSKNDETRLAWIQPGRFWHRNTPILYVCTGIWRLGCLASFGPRNTHRRQGLSAPTLSLSYKLKANLILGSCPTTSVFSRRIYKDLAACEGIGAGWGTGLVSQKKVLNIYLLLSTSLKSRLPLLSLSIHILWYEGWCRAILCGQQCRKWVSSEN